MRGLPGIRNLKLAEKRNLEVRECPNVIAREEKTEWISLYLADPSSMETKGPGLSTKAELRRDGTIGVSLQVIYIQTQKLF